jgi:AcrR family transcriptional regulator
VPRARRGRRISGRRLETDTPACRYGGVGRTEHLPYDSFMSVTAKDAINDENARYRRVIRTAEELFKKVGFRAVTMELVAREANVAKATLYSHFKNKDELYMAVCARMARILRGSVETALMRPGATLDERLADAVVAKHRPVFTLVRGSPHAEELYSYTHSMASEIFANLDVEMLEMLWRTIQTWHRARRSWLARCITAAPRSPNRARPRRRWRSNWAPLPARILPELMPSPVLLLPSQGRQKPDLGPCART